MAKKRKPATSMWSADALLAPRPKRRPSRQQTGPRGWMSAYNEVRANPPQRKPKPWWKR